KHVVMSGLEHVEIRGPADENIHDDGAARKDVGLSIGQKFDGAFPGKKHEQPDSNYGIEHSCNCIRVEVGLLRSDGQFLSRGYSLDSRDGVRTRVESEHCAATPRRFDAQIAETAAKVQDFAVKIRQCQSLKRIEREISFAY